MLPHEYPEVPAARRGFIFGMSPTERVTTMNDTTTADRILELAMKWQNKNEWELTFKEAHGNMMAAAGRLSHPCRHRSVARNRRVQSAGVDQERRATRRQLRDPCWLSAALANLSRRSGAVRCRSRGRPSIASEPTLPPQGRAPRRVLLTRSPSPTKNDGTRATDQSSAGRLGNQRVDFNGLSLESTVRLRAEAFAHVRHHIVMVLSIAAGIESLDTARQQFIAERSVDEQQALVSAARQLLTLVDGGTMKTYAKNTALLADAIDVWLKPSTVTLTLNGGTSCSKLNGWSVTRGTLCCSV